MCDEIEVSVYVVGDVVELLSRLFVWISLTS